MAKQATVYTRFFETLGCGDIALVGGKNASLGEMIGSLKNKGIAVPDGFATTADSYWLFIEHNGLRDSIQELIAAYRKDETRLKEVGRQIRQLFLEAEFPAAVRDAIFVAYDELCRRNKMPDMDVAARSSATAEDLPEASFAGQLETYLNVTGHAELERACLHCFASLFTNRAIVYREQHGFEHMDVALSVGIQKMVRSDKASAGVMFTLDTDTGFPDSIVINAAWGLGENVVQGSVNPDQYEVYAPLLGRSNVVPIIGKTLGDKVRKMVYAADDFGSKTTNVETTEDERTAFVLEDDEIIQLAGWAQIIEDHYGHPMDIEWAKDGPTGALYCVQARPETVYSQTQGGRIKSYKLNETGDVIVEGMAIGQAITSGKAIVLEGVDQIEQFEEGAILVTTMTDPDWGPIISKAGGIITEQGGRTSHAAIVSRELGIAAIVGAKNATTLLEDCQTVTISCVEGDVGRVYDGALDYKSQVLELDNVPATRTNIMMNIASPGAAMHWWQLPVQGIGLARMEYLISNTIQIHPMALVRFDEVDDDARRRIDRLTASYDDRCEYFVDLLGRGIAKIAAVQYPHPAIVRMSDFKTSEYAQLIGGRAFEPHESDPMLGWRGASRYYSDDYKAGFALECRAVKRAREEIGMDNIVVMVPFCRSPEEGRCVIDVMAANGLTQGINGLKVYVMAEIPTNILQASEFAEIFDGFSIGTNDLTQLTLGVSRNSERLANIFDEENASVKFLIRHLIEIAHQYDRPVGLCGQAPSDYPAFAEFLVEAGIDSISVNPDSVLDVSEHVSCAERAGKNKKRPPSDASMYN